MAACVDKELDALIASLLLLILMLWHRQTILESKGDKLSYSAECRIQTQGPWNRISSRLNAHWQIDYPIVYMRIPLKSSTSSCSYILGCIFPRKPWQIRTKTRSNLFVCKCILTEIVTTWMLGARSPELIHWDRMTYICVTKVDHHWSR